MGAVIDTIIGTVIGGGLSSITKAGLKAAVKKMGRKKLSRLVRQHLLRKFSAAYIISSKVIETAQAHGLQNIGISMMHTRTMGELTFSENEK